MKIIKIFSIAVLIIFYGNNLVLAETLKFPTATYEGEVKKGKAHGKGTFTFSDGSTYEGKVSKNRIHGNGKYIDASGKVYEGKFKYGTLYVKIDAKTRDVVKIKPKKGFSAFTEIKGEGSTSNKWFEAEKNSSGVYELTAKGKADMELAASEGTSGDGGGSSGC